MMTELSQIISQNRTPQPRLAGTGTGAPGFPYQAPGQFGPPGGVGDPLCGHPRRVAADPREEMGGGLRCGSRGGGRRGERLSPGSYPPDGPQLSPWGAGIMPGRHAGARVAVVDIGVNHDFGHIPELIDRKVAYGSRNMAKEPALTRDEALKALLVGVEMAEQATANGADAWRPGKWASATPPLPRPWPQSSPANRWPRSPAGAPGSRAWSGATRWR